MGERAGVALELHQCLAIGFMPEGSLIRSGRAIRFASNAARWPTPQAWSKRWWTTVVASSQSVDWTKAYDSFWTRPGWNWPTRCRGELSQRPVSRTPYATVADAGAGWAPFNEWRSACSETISPESMKK